MLSMKATLIIIYCLVVVIRQSRSGEPVACPGSAAMCDGCQCCPNLKMCPNARGCPFKCPNDDKPVDVSSSTKNPAASSERPSVTNPTPEPDHGTGEHRLKFSNKCKYDVWVGSLNNPGKSLPHKGGWYMKAGMVYNITVPREWAGRFWGRTNCEWLSNGQQFVCATGDCGRRFECKGFGGEPPVTLAEFTFDAHAGLDYFDVSLVDGYNLPMTITPVKNSYVSGSGICEKCGCTSDLNEICPSELKVEYRDKTVACKSACAAFGTNQYCCHGEYDCSPHGKCPDGKIKCDPVMWPVNYAKIFKSACQTSYSYAYDDPSSTFTCTGNKYAHYDITFCD